MTVWVSLHPVHLVQSVSLDTLILNHCTSFDLSLISDSAVFPSIRTYWLAPRFVTHVFSRDHADLCTSGIATLMREWTLILKMSSLLTAIPTLSIHLLRFRIFLRDTHRSFAVRAPSSDMFLGPLAVRINPLLVKVFPPFCDQTCLGLRWLQVAKFVWKFQQFLDLFRCSTPMEL